MAVIECAPTPLKAAMLQVACPELFSADAVHPVRALAPSKNSTVPSVMPVPATAAVKVTGLPVVLGLLELLTTVVVPIRVLLVLLANVGVPV